jgi:5'-3' exonuclease
MLKFFKSIFLGEKSADKSIIEAKYFRKYKDRTDQRTFLKLIEEYKSGDIIFEPIREKLSEADHENLYQKIDNADILSDQEKIEAIIGIMMILDGSFPETYITSHLEKVFGKEFLETIEKKEKNLRMILRSRN